MSSPYSLALTLSPDDRDRLFHVREMTGQPVTDQIRRAVRHWLDTFDGGDHDAVAAIRQQPGRLGSVSVPGGARPVRRRVRTHATKVHAQGSAAPVDRVSRRREGGPRA